MSKRGVFNFHTEVNPQFNEVSRIDSASDPDYLYYNGSIINNSTNTTQSSNDPQIQYQDTRSLPILKDKSKYAISVENFSLNGAGKVLPLFIPQIRQYKGNSKTVLNTNPNNTIYDVTFTWQYGPKESPHVFQSTRTVQWQPQNQAAWTIQPPNPYVYPQLEIDYYYCYSYSWWLKLVNSALEMAWSDVKLAVETFSPDVLFGTKCPYYTYDEKTNLFSLSQDANTCLVPYGDTPGSPPSTAGLVPPSNPPNPQDPYGAASDPSYSPGEYSFVGWNTNWDNLLTNFNTVYYSDGVRYPTGILGTRISSPNGTESSAQAIEISATQTDLITSFTGNTLSFTPRTSSLGVTISKFTIGFPTILTQSVEIPTNTYTTLYLNIGLVSSYSLVVGKTYVINVVGNTDWTTLGSADNNVGTQFVATGQATLNKTGNATGLLALIDVPYITNTGLKLLASGNPVTIVAIQPYSITVTSTVSLSAQVWSLTFPPATSSSVTTAGDSMLLDIGESFNSFVPLTNGIVLNTPKPVTFNNYVENITIIPNGIGNTDLYYSGTPYSFSPVVTYSNQTGVFDVGDIVQGQDSETQAEIISVIGSNSGSTNSTTITLVYSGQKNIFQIGDTIEDVVTGAQATIANITGENTGYATMSFIKQDGSFGNNEVIVSYDPTFGLGGATIISVTGENTGYANCTYINEHDPAGGLASVFTSGEYLTFNNGEAVIAFAQVVQDNPQVTTSSGNEGYVQVRIIDPNIANYLTGGVLIVTGSLSGTQCDLQGVNYPGTGTLLLNNISGSFYVGNTITDKIGDKTITAQLQNFSYLSGGTLTLTNVTGTFGINNQINSLSPGPGINPIFALSNVAGLLSVGDEITNGTATGIISNVSGELLGTQVIQVSEISGTFAPGDYISGGIYSTLGLTGNYHPYSFYGVLNIGDQVVCTTGGTGTIGTGTVKTLDSTILKVFLALSTPSPGDLFESQDLSTKFTVVSYSSPNLVVSDVSGSLYIGQCLKCNNTGAIAQILQVTSKEIQLSNVTGLIPTSGVLYDNSTNIASVSYTGLTGNSYNGVFNLNDNITYGTATATIAGITGSTLYLSNVVGTLPPTGTIITEPSNIYLSINMGGISQGIGFPEDFKPFSIGQVLVYQGNYLTIKYVSTRFLYKQIADTLYYAQFVTLSNAKGLYIPTGASFSGVVYPSVYGPPSAEFGGYTVVDPSVPLNVQASIYSTTGITHLNYAITSSLTYQTTGTLALTTANETFANAITQTYSLGTGATLNGGLVLRQLTGPGFTASEIIKDLKTLATVTYDTTVPQTITCITSGASGIVQSDNGTYMVVEDISEIPQLEEKIISSVSSKATVSDWKLFPVNDIVSSGSGWAATIRSSSFNKIQLEILTSTLFPTVGDGFGNPGHSASIESIDNYLFLVSPGIAGSSWTISIPSLVSDDNVTLANPTIITTNLSSSQSIFTNGNMLNFNLLKEISQQVQLFLPENVAAVEVPQCKYQQLIPGPSFVNNPLASPAWYLVMIQDFESTSSLWSPVASIVIATTFITVREEYSGTPITLGTGNLGSNATTSSFQKVLLEVPIQDLPQVGLKGLIQYKPQVETFSSLGSSRAELKNIDVLFQWRNRLTNSLTPLELSNSGSATIRLLFKKIHD